MARAALREAAGKAGAPPLFALAGVIALFFGWGFISANNDPLIAAVRGLLGLGYTQALLIQIASFAAFFLMSLPAAALVARLGPARAIGLALAGMIAGCLAMQAVRVLPVFAMVLAAIFMLASGITALQVVANPLVAALGAPKHRPARLTLAHSFNALGVVCGVHFGARAMLGEAPDASAAGFAAIADAYLAMALLIACLGVLILAARRAIAAAPLSVPPSSAATSALAALRSRWALLGAVGIALYVGAEVTIGTMLILYLAQPDTLGLPLDVAGARVATFYWGGALVGRFVGSGLLRVVPAPRLLAVAGLAAAGLCLAALVLPGTAGARGLLAVGLCNAIMFPTIFALSLERSSAGDAATSGLLVLAIGPGAALPLLAGGMADMAGLVWAFAVPVAAYLYIAGFALARPSRPG